MRTARSTIFRIERSMKRTLIPLLALLAAGPPAQIRGEELRQVTAVRCWSLSGATRVAIEVDGEFEFRAERAHNPERIFFDVERSRPRINGHRFYSANVADKLVKKVRVAETQTGVTRVVLDLQSNADYSATQLSNPDRLGVELRPVAQTSRSARVLQDPPPPQVVTQTLPAPPVLAPSPVPGTGPLPNVSPVAPAASPPMRLQPETQSETEPPAKSSRTTERVEPGHAAKLAGDWPGSLTRALGLKIRRGVLEKDLVLDVALRLGKLIESRMGSEVIFTRSDDIFIPLERRTAIANEKRADLFLSIHANSSPYPRIGGVESYY